MFSPPPFSFSIPSPSPGSRENPSLRGEGGTINIESARLTGNSTSVALASARMTPVQDEVLNQLFDDLASIPVPPSFKIFSDVDPITLHTEMLSFVGFTPETAQAIAIQVESSGSSSLTTTALEWLQSQWEGCLANFVGTSYDALEKAEVYSSCYQSLGIVKEFASDCAKRYRRPIEEYYGHCCR
jgi:hypothetical protein